MDELRENVADAHRQARHVGPWETCTDPVCAAVERYIYFRTKPTVAAPSQRMLDEMVRG